MILKKERTVRLSETDATGILYFTNLFKFAVEVFEDYFISVLQEVDETFATTKIILPIVDAKGEFKSQITVGDIITITIESIEPRTTSLVAYTTIKKGELLVANVSLTHVAISKETQRPVLLKNCGYLLAHCAN